MINLLKEFNQIVDDFGHKVILIKPNKKQECSCLHRITRSARADCPICLGTGYVVYSKPILVRNVMKYSLENYKYQAIGSAVINQNNFYLKSEDRPQQDDLLIQLNFEGNKPYVDEYSNVYLIDNVAPLRQESGEIAFFLCSTEAQPINKNYRLSKVMNKYTSSTNSSEKQIGYELYINSDYRLPFISNDFDIRFVNNIIPEK